MKGESICETCGKLFGWSRRKKGEYPRFCSRKCLGQKVQTWCQVGNYKKRIDDPKQQFECVKRSYEKHVIKQKGCWGWSASFDKDGYGQMSSARRYGVCKAHRASWLIHRGEIPKGISVLHKCDNKPCTNPDHLFLGTTLENSRDLVYKDKQLKGSKNGIAKLNENEVKEIKIALQNGVTGTYLGKKYGVTKTTIWKIKHQKNWKHVE